MKYRWEYITRRYDLFQIDYSKWQKEIFDPLIKLRTAVEHNDFKFPNAKELKDFRNKIPEFATWLFESGNFW